MHSDPARRTILVVGGAGSFGSRLVHGLLAETAFDIVAIGRGKSAVEAFAAACNLGLPQPRVQSWAIDAAALTAPALRARGAFAVVDAAGPFQGGAYRLAAAAIDARLHYVDLADARDFVSGFSSLDPAAKAAGVTLLTGASSTPALSNAALDAITAGWRRIDAIDVAISPGNRAPRGLSVVRAILSYAGRPVRVFTGGGWQQRPGWGLTVRQRAPDGSHRLLSLCETPDLDILPERFRPTRSALFRAGLELPLLHLGLWLASLPVRWRLLRSLAPLAAPARWLADRTRSFGTDAGFMWVEASGLDAAGDPVRGRWTLTAEGGDGPFVPTAPALAVLRALADGSLSASGAGACVGQVSLEQIEEQLRRRKIRTSMSLEHPQPLYRRVLGEARFSALPPAIAALHRPWPALHTEGRTEIDGAEGPLAWLAARLFGFPAAGTGLPTEVTIEPAGDGERWTRQFGNARFHSMLTASKRDGHLVERFGPFSFELELQTDAAGVSGMPIRRWRLGPLPLPLFLAPLSLAAERVDADGRFSFDVEMRLPLRLGRIVRYRGWLAGSK